MDLVQKEHDRLWKRHKASQGIKNVQNTIDLLQSARDAIAAGTSWVSSSTMRMAFAMIRMMLTSLRISDPSHASFMLAKLQNSIQSSFDAVNDSLKETHSGLNKYTKALDKVRCRELSVCL